MERCNPSADCKYYPACFEDTHHRYFPASDYETTVERTFRTLPENKEEMCRAVHEELHATETPPTKPSREVMVYAIRESQVFLSKRKQRIINGTTTSI